jgi:hypothetical protein
LARIVRLDLTDEAISHSDQASATIADIKRGSMGSSAITGQRL